MNKIEDYKNKYSYTVNYSTADDLYIAKCLELGIQAHGNTQLEAISEVMIAVETALQWLTDDGKKLPEPLSLQDFSGKLNLRMTPEKHREVAIKAKELDISINKYITSKL